MGIPSHGSHGLFVKLCLITIGRKEGDVVWRPHPKEFSAMSKRDDVIRATMANIVSLIVMLLVGVAPPCQLTPKNS